MCIYAPDRVEVNSEISVQFFLAIIQNKITVSLFGSSRNASTPHGVTVTTQMTFEETTKIESLGAKSPWCAFFKHFSQLNLSLYTKKVIKTLKKLCLLCWHVHDCFLRNHSSWTSSQEMLVLNSSYPSALGCSKGG